MKGAIGIIINSVNLLLLLLSMDCHNGMPLSPVRRVHRMRDDDVVEGDIKLSGVDPYKKDVWLRSAVADKTKVWTNGIIPFYLDDTFFNKQELAIIHAAIEEFHAKTCIKFVPRTSEMPYLYVTPLTNCWSEIGMPPEEGIRILSLGEACLEKKGTVIHELMHVIGFWHEQNRVDRDDYVTIKWENIKEEARHNFFKYSEDKVDTLHEPYDYNSIMHYSSYAFAKDPYFQTIVPKIPVMIGQRFGLSPMDIIKIEKLYGCSNSSISFTNHDHSAAKPAQPSKFNSNKAGILFPAIVPDMVPLPFKFNWTKPTTSNPKIIFPTG